MSHTAWTAPTARKRHHCALCARVILPGEQYHRFAILDGGTAWTGKYCDHCLYVMEARRRDTREDEYYMDEIAEWLEDEHPTWFAQISAGWRYPDGELLPPPWQNQCHACGQPITLHQIWCTPCDRERIERVGQQLEMLAGTVEGVS